MKRMHVVISEDELEDLERISRSTGAPKSRLIRLAVRNLVEEEDRKKLQEEMRAYAEEHGTESRQFVDESAAHVTRRLLRETKW